MIFGYKFATGCKGVDPMTADLFTGKDEIDREEALYLARKEAEAEKNNDAGWFYQKFVSWLF